MNSTIKQLQNEINEDRIPASVILNKALDIAIKLRQNDFADWIKREHKGYSDRKLPVPDYRFVRGSLKFYEGGIWSSIDEEYKTFEDEEKRTKMAVPVEVVTIEEWAFKYPDKFQMAAPRILEQHVSKGSNLDIKLCFEFQSYQLKIILKQIKLIVYEWLSKLEANGIAGSENKFTQDEVNKARTVHYTFNFYSDVNKTQFNIESTDNIQENKES